MAGAAGGINQCHRAIGVVDGGGNVIGAAFDVAHDARHRADEGIGEPAARDRDDLPRRFLILFQQAIFEFVGQADRVVELLKLMAGMLLRMLMDMILLQ